MFSQDTDVGERLYSQDTAASLHKRSRVPMSAFTAASRTSTSFREHLSDESIDVREEVDRMYDRIMASIDDENDVDSSPHKRPSSAAGGARWEPFEVSDSTSSRIAATKALMRPLDLKNVHRHSTFGSGRRGMSDPVKKESGPAPGSYFNDSTNSIRSTTSKSSTRSTSAPGFSFGKASRPSTATGSRPSSRHEREAKKEPGPGDYYVPSSFSPQQVGKKGTFSRAPSPRTRVDKDKATMPGPGSYATEERLPLGQAKQRSSAFSSTTPRMPEPKSSTPGPGDYYRDGSSENNSNKGPLLRGRTPPRKTTAHETPGVGTYNTVVSDKRERASRGVIPTAGRKNEFCGTALTNLSPGPGDYNTAVPLGADAPSIKFHFKEEQKVKPTPGPGQYDPRVDPDGPKWSLAGKLKRPDPEVNEGPGPGEYDIVMSAELPSAPKAVFPKAKREIGAAEDNGVPGPGAYVVDEGATTEGNGVVFGTDGRKPLYHSTAAETPGPGAYNHPETELPGGTIVSTAKRFETNPDGRAENPGPGAYNLPSTMDDTKGPVVGSSVRPTNVLVAPGAELVPGPGAYSYDAAPFGADAPAYSISVQPRPEPRATEEQAPGPGAYDTAVEATKVGGAIGTAKRFDATKTDTDVGPGAYDAEMDAVYERTPAAIIGSAPKEIIKPTEEDMVGPGAYEASTGFPQGPAVVMPTAPRFAGDDANKREASMVPGPGAYDPHVERDAVDQRRGAVFTTGPGHETVDKNKAELPGPGAYFPVHPSDKNDINSGVTFGTAPRGNAQDGDIQREVPGPGAYHYDDGPHGPSAIMLFRHDGKDEAKGDGGDGSAVPGPGAYYPVNPNIDVVGASAFIGSDRREDTDLATKARKDVPGPGAYYQEYGITEEGGATSVGFTRAPRFASDAEKADLPGPGYYVLPDERKAGGGGVIGTAPRAYHDINDELPGPGAYNMPKEVTPQVTINAVPKKLTQDDNGVPGPGAYSLPEEKKDTAPTIGGSVRPPILLPSEAPGPGAYTPADPKSAPAVSFPVAMRDVADPNAENPGPGAYSVQAPSSAPAVSFTTAGRKTVDDQRDVPGPGTYHPDSVQVGERAPEYSIPRAVPPQPGNIDIPGPGAYDGVVLEKKLPMTIGSSKPLQDERERVPGPGAYEVERKMGDGVPAVSFGKQEKDLQSVLNENPGPGAYETGVKSTAPAVSFGTAPLESTKKPEPTPGPGAYAAAPQVEGPAHSIGVQERFPNRAVEEATPGPGAYGAMASTLGGPSPQFGTGPRNDPALESDTPGPGAYDLSRVKPEGEGPSYTFAPLPVAASLAAPFASPGPGEYDITAGEKKEGVAFPTAVRFPEAKADAGPGPASYEAHVPSEAPSVSFGISKRPDQVLPSALNPGPGTYDPNNYRGDDGPAFTMTGKPKPPKEETEPLPGPGEYDTTVRDKGPSISFAMAKPVDEKNDEKRAALVPGPGSYAIKSTLNPQGVSIPQARRGDGEEDPRDYPGPGQYYVEAAGNGMFDGPSYSIPTAVDKPPAAHFVPGPGAYDHDGTGQKAPAYSFPTAVRDESKGSTNIVGPGAYDLGPAPYAGPSHSIAGASPHGGPGEGVDPKPGPGQYFHPSVWGDGGVPFQGKWAPPPESAKTPGPGQYHLHDHDPYSRDLATVIDFSKGGPRLQQTRVQDVNPGPGFYNTRLEPGNGVSILNRFPPKYFEPMPGPPDYHPAGETKPFYEPLAK